MVNPYQSPSETSTDGKRIVDTPVARSSWNPLGVIIFGLMLPGLPSMMIRQDRVGFLRMVILIVSVPIGFVFFGPIWGEWLFASTPYREWGLYPFLVLCAIVPILSVVLGMQDLYKVRDAGFREPHTGNSEFELKAVREQV